jgi:hypothetical protein
MAQADLITSADISRGLVVTVGSPYANSYVDTQFAEDYFARTLRNKLWMELDWVQEDGGAIPLLEAMIFVEMQEYLGLRANDDQALMFPRYGGALTSPFQPRLQDQLRDRHNRLWQSDDIPLPVKEAQCEQALAIAKNGRWLDQKYTSEKVTMPAAEMQIATSADLGTICRAAWLKLTPFMVAGGKRRTTR